MAKTVGFAQLRNEREKKNLENWIKCMDSVCDKIYIWDNSSTDNSQEIYKQYAHKTVVYQSPENNFFNELFAKQQLLDKIKVDHPDTDWILWLDGDLLLDGRLMRNEGAEFKRLCQRGIDSGIGGFTFGHYNLWRSDLYYRVDEGYHGLHGNWLPLWRFRKDLRFMQEAGLHRPQYPVNLGNLASSGYSVLHKGFSTDKQIVDKVLLYKSLGQKGWDLTRLSEEKELKVEIIPYDILPVWFVPLDTKCPVNKPKLIDLYKEELL